LRDRILNFDHLGRIEERYFDVGLKVRVALKLHCNSRVTRMLLDSIEKIGG